MLFVLHFVYALVTGFWTMTDSNEMTTNFVVFGRTQDWQKCYWEQPAGQLRLLRVIAPKALWLHAAALDTAAAFWGLYYEMAIRVLHVWALDTPSYPHSSLSKGQVTDTSDISLAAPLQGGSPPSISLGPEGWFASVSGWKRSHNSVHPGNK